MPSGGAPPPVPVPVPASVPVPSRFPLLLVTQLDLLRLVGPTGPLVAELRLDPTGAHLRHPLAADVVAPPLEDGEVERRRQSETRIDLWQVLLGQLVLERFGGRGDDHLLPAQRGRDEVGEGLACPGSGLDDEMGPGGHRLGHGAAHLLLLGAVLSAGHLRRDLVEGGDSVVARLAKVGGGIPGSADAVKPAEVRVDPALLHGLRSCPPPTGAWTMGRLRTNAGSEATHASTFSVESRAAETQLARRAAGLAELDRLVGWRTRSDTWRLLQIK